MPDYSQGKIYTIRCRDDDSLIYVGSTTLILSQTLAGHKRLSTKLKYQNIKLYQTVNNDWDNWYIELYELYPCTCKMELDKREGEVIRNIATLNARIAGRTNKEYYKDNSGIIIEKNKLYYQRNADKKREYQRQYYKLKKSQVDEIVDTTL